MEVFKGEVGGLTYYFKPKGDNEYLLEPYKHKETKPFKIARDLKDGDNNGKRQWLISSTEKVPDSVKNLEADFSTYIEEMLNQPK